MAVRRRYDHANTSDFSTYQELFVRLINQKKEFDDKFKGVTIELGNVYQEQENIRNALSSYASNTLIAAEKEVDNMSDLAEIKAKVNSMDASVNKLATDIAVLNNTVSIKFDTTNKTLDEIKASLDSIKSEGVSSKRFTVTTTISIASLLVAIGACLVVWLG